VRWHRSGWLWFRQPSLLHTIPERLGDITAHCDETRGGRRRHRASGTAFARHAPTWHLLLPRFMRTQRRHRLVVPARHSPIRRRLTLPPPGCAIRALFALCCLHTIKAGVNYKLISPGEPWTCGRRGVSYAYNAGGRTSLPRAACRNRGDWTPSPPHPGFTTGHRYIIPDALRWFPTFCWRYADAPQRDSAART